MNKLSHHTDVIVIGAGPAGSVATAKLLQRGYRVIVLEKQRFPRFVIGESLLPKCMEALSEVGFFELLEARGYQVKRRVQFLRDNAICWFNFDEQYSQGWTWTWQVPRSDFDKTLADEIARRGADVRYEHSVIDVDIAEEGCMVRAVDQFDEKLDFTARYVIDASGYGRVLPRLLQLDAPIMENPKAAIYCHFTDQHRPDGDPGTQSTFVIHRQDVWTWSIPFSDGITSVGFVGNPDYIDGFYHEDRLQFMRALIDDVPYMKSRFGDQQDLIPVQYIKAYGVSSRDIVGPGYIIAGNSNDFIDPVFSSGVTFATESGLCAGHLVANHLDGKEVDWQKEYVDHMKQGIDTFRTYVNEWYDGALQDIFFYSNKEQNIDIKRKICSVLAGYVWDQTNPFVGPKRQRALDTLSKIIHLF